MYVGGSSGCTYCTSLGGIPGLYTPLPIPPGLYTPLPIPPWVPPACPGYLLPACPGTSCLPWVHSPVTTPGYIALLPHLGTASLLLFPGYSIPPALPWVHSLVDTSWVHSLVDTSWVNVSPAVSPGLMSPAVSPGLMFPPTSSRVDVPSDLLPG